MSYGSLIFLVGIAVGLLFAFLRALVATDATFDGRFVAYLLIGPVVPCAVAIGMAARARRNKTDSFAAWFGGLNFVYLTLTVLIKLAVSLRS